MSRAGGPGRYEVVNKCKHMGKGAPARGTLTTSTPLLAMSPAQGRWWIAGLQDRLQAKQARERSYLDRRAKRGVHTSTDDAYEADQVLEEDLLALLEEVLQWFNET